MVEMKKAIATGSAKESLATSSGMCCWHIPVCCALILLPATLLTLTTLDALRGAWQSPLSYATV